MIGAMNASSTSAAGDAAAPRPHADPAICPVGSDGLAHGPRQVSSEALLQGAQELLIEHQGALYRLRLTSLGKLILTK
jgi:hemin uptake protein HemP